MILWNKGNSRRRRLGWLCGAAVIAICGLSSAAQADCTEDPSTPFVNCNPFGGASSVSFSQTQSLTFAPATETTVDATAFNTEIVGKLNGGTLYDQDFAAAFATPTVQAGVNSAILAITTAGGPGVVITGPTLVSHTVTNSSASSSVYSLDPSTPIVPTNALLASPPAYVTQTTTTTFGPATINATTNATLSEGTGGNPANPNAGIYTLCTVSSLPSTTKPTCAAVNGGTFTIPAGQTNISINQDANYLIDTTTTTTDTTTTAEVYDIDGMVVRPIGTIHAVIPVAGFDQSEGFARRLLAEGWGEHKFIPWVEGWGQWNKTDGRGGVAGDTRDSYGVDAGFSYAVSPLVRLGLGVDHGHTSIDLPTVDEQGRVDLTEIGGFGRVGGASGPYLAMAGSYGWGHDQTEVSPIGADQTSTANEHLHLASASAELGWRLKLGRLGVTPEVGGVYTHVTLDGFSENGSVFDLKSRGGNFHRTLAWAGLALDHSFGPTEHAFTLTAAARGVHLGGDLAPALGVGFADDPSGSEALTIQGPREKRWGAEFSAGAAYQISASLQAFVSGDGILRDHAHTSEVRGGIRVTL